MRKIIILLIIWGLTTAAFAKAYFAGKEERILKSDIIAIVNITDVVSIEPDKQYGNQEANASVNKILKGNAENNITFSIPRFFPCAIVSVEKGLHIVFLKHEENKLSGVNWHFSYRPIKNNKVEWYSNDDTSKLEEKDFEEVIEDITEVIEKQKNRNNLAVEEIIDRTTGRRDVCELHNVHMHKVKVPIVYGLPPPWSEEEKKYFDAKEKFFPNANDGKVEGGCMSSPQKKANIYVCPRCEKERNNWLKTNRSKNQATQQGVAADVHTLSTAELNRYPNVAKVILLRHWVRGLSTKERGFGGVLRRSKGILKEITLCPGLNLMRSDGKSSNRHLSVW